MKWLTWSGEREIVLSGRGRVSGALQAHRRPEGSAQHPGQVPGSADRRLRRQARHRPERARRARRVSGAELEGARGACQSAAAPGFVPAHVPVPVSVEGTGRDPRSAGPDPDSPRHPGEREPDPGRDDHRHAREVRDLERRAVDALRAGQGRGPHRGRGAEAGRQGRVDVEREVAHLPVLADEVTFLLRPRRGGWVVDGTIGMGGHAERLLEAGGAGTRLLGLDADPEALARAGQRLARFGERVTLRHGSFREIGGHAREAGIGPAATVLLDLGLSSYQLDASGRGFSFQGEEPLDMRFDPREGATAAELLGRLSAEEIAGLLAEYGEERHARRIARVLVEQRRRSPLRTAADLVSVVKRALPRDAWSRRTHVATRTFQAVRMAVNDEPGALAEALPQAAALLEDGGRLGVISFHSGEDRVVKHAFRSLAGRGFVELEPSPVTAGREETAQNPRARSAKLRVLARREAA